MVYKDIRISKIVSFTPSTNIIMVQTKTSKDKRKRPTGTSPKNIVIVYEQPTVVVQRHYTKTFIPEVNPDDYEKKFGRVLLDTSALLALIRRLNIEEDQVKSMRIFQFDMSFSV